MAIISFGDTFAAPWKKWALANSDEEELVPDTSASASMGWDIPGMETMPAEPDPWVDPTSYDGSQWDAAPVADEGFFSGIGDALNGPGEGWGFDLISEPTDNWASQYESPVVDEPWADPTSYDGSSWDAEPVAQGYETWDFSTGLPANLAERYTPEETWADVEDWRNRPPEDLDTSEWNANQLASAPGGIFSRIGDSLGSGEGWGFDLISEPTDDWAAQYEPEPFAPAEEWGGGMGFAPPEEAPAPSRWSALADQYAELPQPEYELSLNDWSMPNLAATAGLPNDWWRMDADEKGEYLWQSGLATDALTADDWAAMSPDVRFKLGYAEQEGRNEGNLEWLGGVGMDALRVGEGALNQTAQLGMDAFYDPIASNMGTGSLTSIRPGSGGGITMNATERETALDDTIANASEFDVSDPLGSSWDFLSAQNEDYKERPFAEQMIGQVFVPGNGIFGSIDDAPRLLRAVDRGADLLQGGFISDIPGAGTAFREVVLPGAAGGATGALAEVIAPDQTYGPDNPLTGEGYNPSFWESVGIGTGAGILGPQAIKRGILPGQGIKDISEQVAEEALRANISIKVANELDAAAIDYLERYPRITDSMSDGRFVRDEIPNTASISASLDDYYTVGVRDIPISEFTGGGYVSADDTQRVRELAEAIRESGEINPLIVVLDKDGPYVLEGSHRLDALRELGAESLPAYVVVDMDEATGLGFKGFPEEAPVSTSASRVPPEAAERMAREQTGNPLVADMLGRIEVALAADRATAQQRLLDWQSGIGRAAIEQTGDATLARELFGQRTIGRRMEDVVERLDFTPEEIDALGNVVLRNAQDMGYGTVTIMNSLGALRNWANPNLPQPHEGQLKTLRNILTGKSWEPEVSWPGSVDDVTRESMGLPPAADDVVQPGLFGDIPSKRIPKTVAPEYSDNPSYNWTPDEIAPLFSLGLGAPAKEMASLPFPGGWMGNPLPSDLGEVVPSVPRIPGEWEAVTGVAPNSPSFGASGSPRFADSTVTAANIPGLKRFSDDLSRRLTKQEAEYIDSLMPYVPPEHREWIVSEWDQVMGNPGRFQTDSSITALPGLRNISDSRPLTKGEAEFLDSLSEYIPPTTLPPRMRNQWDEVFGYRLSETGPGNRAPLAGETIGGRPIRERPAVLPDHSRDATTLPKDHAEFIDTPYVPLPSTPPDPRIGAWSQKMLDSLSGVRSRTKRDELLGAAEWDLRRDVNPTAPSRKEFERLNKEDELRQVKDEVWAVTKAATESDAAASARSRVSARLQEIENEKIAEDIVNWRASAYEDLWRLSGTERGGSLGALVKKGTDKARGAINVPLADGLDRYGQKLEDLLRTRDVPEDVARELVHREQNLYIDARFGDKLASDPEKAFVEHLYTAVYQGRYKPDVPYFTGSGGKRINEIAKPDEKTGEVAGWIKGGETLAKKVKNQVFGLTDMAAIGLNALPAITQGSMGITAGYMARLLDVMGYPVIDRPTMAAIRRDAPLYIKTGASQSQDLLNPEAGTILGALSNITRDITGVGLKPLDIVDTKLSKWNDLLSKVQYQWIMDTAIRKPLYEGNLVLMKPFGVDVGTVSAQRAAGNMADAVTSAATLSRTNTRRSMEGMLAGSAMFTRGQGNVLINAGKLLNGSGPERIVAATTILSFLGAVGIASTAAGNSIDLEPIKDGKFNNNFGTVTIPSVDGPISFKLFPQTQVARVAAQSMSALANMDAKEGYDAWAKFLIGRTGPLPGNILKGAAGIGYDPSAESWSYPEINLPGERFDVEGKGGVWGGSMSFLERALAFSPLPTNVTSGLLGWMDGEPPSIQETIANLAGLSAYNVGEFQQALAKEGVESLDDLGTEGDREIAQREFYYKYRDQLEFRDDSGVVSEKTKQKEVATGQFEKNITGETVGAWREKMDDYNNQISGAFQQMGLSPDKRPEQPGIDQQIWDFNETFRKARLDADGNDTGLINPDTLDDLQAGFWAQNPDPETRRRLIEYQLANKGMEAERLYVRDMAILNGFDPDTGLPMVYPEAKPGDKVSEFFAGKPAPSYFDMTRYKYNVIDNQQMKPVVDEYTKWKQTLPPKLREGDKEQLFRYFIKEEMPTAPDGQPWNAIRIDDFVNYGKDTKETMEYQYYKDAFSGPVAWMNRGAYWNKVLQEHE